MSAGQKPLAWGRFRVNSVSTEGGEKCLGLHVVSWVEFQSEVWHSCQAVREEARCHCKELLNFNDLFYYVVEGSIVSLSPGSKKRINWTENGRAGKLTVIRGM